MDDPVLQRIEACVLQFVTDLVQWYRAVNDGAVQDFEISDDDAPDATSVKHLISKQGLSLLCPQELLAEDETCGDPVQFSNPARTRKATGVLSVMAATHNLRLQGRHMCKRALYYSDVQLFGQQGASNDALHAMCSLLSVPQYLTNINPSSKGLYAGPLRYTRPDGSIAATEDAGQHLVPPGAYSLAHVSTTASFILVVEKDTIFSRLVEDGAPTALRCLLVTGKGYPDVATRQLVARLARDRPSLEILGLCDADPDGLGVLWTYKAGSDAMSRDKAALEAPRLRYVGMCIKDVPAGALRMPLSQHDRAKAGQLLGNPALGGEWRRELEEMLHAGEKAELEAMYKPGLLHLSRTWLPQVVSEALAGDR
jgi:meiotic recombination protein SPO11